MAADKGHPGRPQSGFSLWKGNLLVFGLLFAFVLFHFFLQAARARTLFTADARDHARLVADIVGLQARLAIRSAEVIDETLSLFLTNTARFVAYLDSVEPFDSHELAAFALEAGLSGVAVIRKDGTFVDGPEGWARQVTGCDISQDLIHDTASHEIRLIHTLPGGGCIVTGVPGRDIEELRREVSLERVLLGISHLHGISFVKVVDEEPVAAGQEVPVSFVNRDGRPVAEVTVRIGDRGLVLGLDASPLRKRIAGLFRDLALYGGLLAISAAILSWLLYRQQTSHLSQVEEYEKMLSQRREEAALGRAAASIAHEVRNPLNAMSMGLQRLSMEADELLPGHRRLISVVMESLARTNGIVSNLLDYARTPKIHLQETRLDLLFEDVEAALGDVLDEKRLVIRREIPVPCLIRADRDLLRQVVVNLLRNAAEAESRGGSISISVKYEMDDVVLQVKNRGLLPAPDELAQVFEPYFTTKTRGTGLGLAISRRIVSAHGGTIAASIRDGNIFVVTVRLPRNPLPKNTDFQTEAAS